MINYVVDIAKCEMKDRFDAIVGILKENGISYEVQRTYGLIGNIVVPLCSNAKEKKIVLGAHYDSIANTPAANDNAAACSILLNLILEVKRRGIEKNIDVVFFDIIESRRDICCEYVNNLNNVEVVFNLDMCGVGNNTCVCTKNLYSAQKKKYVAQYKDLKVFNELPPSDEKAFVEKGFPTIFVINSTDKDLNWFAAFPKIIGLPEYVHHMHQFSDTPEKLNYDQMEKIYDYLLACIYE